jgi:hypothetical protein
MKYRKKPIIVEAEQWFPGKHINGVYRNVSDNLSLKFDYAWIDTLEGKMKVMEGDYIITGVKGERYCCKPDIFKMTYEKVE